MEARRKELRLRWRDVADLAGISYETLRTIRRGQYDGMRPLTESGIEQALKWSAGSLAVILAGGNPTRLPDPEAEPVDPAVPILDELHDLDAEAYGLELADRLLEARIRLINKHREQSTSRTSEQPENRCPQTGPFG
jgi:transcriptional regulator with XRE-family HTH domain